MRVNNVLLNHAKRSGFITKAEVISRQAAAQTDYQIQVEDIISRKGDGEDLTFFQKNSILHHWKESYASWKSDAWTKLPNLPITKSQILNVLSGNPSASSASNIANTFLFGDDFHRADSGTVGNGWTDTGGCAIENNKLKQVDTDSIEKAFTINSDLTIEWKGYVTNTGSNNEEIFMNSYGNENDQWLGSSIRPSTNLNGLRFVYSGCAWCAEGTAAYNTDYRFKFIWHESSSTADILYYDGTWHTKTSGTAAYTSTTTNKISFNGNIAGQITYAYFVYVRKYASPEPLIIKRKISGKSGIIKSVCGGIAS